MKIKITNIGNELVTFRYFLVNMVEKLQPEDTVIINTKNDEETNYYLELNREFIKVEKDEEPGPGPEPTPEEELEETDDILDGVIGDGDEPYEGLGGTEEEINEIFDNILGN